MANVVLRSLTKRFGQVTAVDNVSLTIDHGEFLCLLGPSGSGKTTILRLIAGFVEPTAGQIYIGDTPAVGIPPQERNLGMVAQDYGLFPHMSVESNVNFGLRMRGVDAKEARRRVEDAMTLVALAGYGDRMPHQLSGGQQQRVALARALVTRPSVLLLDEPFGALDKKLREQLQVEVRNLQRHIGITTLLVTHDQTEALTMADRIAVMRHGHLEQVGSPHEIYESPQTHFVADFIGLTNFIATQVRQVYPDRLVLEGPRGSTVVAPPDTSAQVGMQIEIAVRPEKITFVSQNQARIEDMNVLPGQVMQIIYLGDHSRISVMLEDETICLLTTENGSRHDLQIGDSVHIAWPYSEGIVLDSSD